MPANYDYIFIIVFLFFLGLSIDITGLTRGESWYDLVSVSVHCTGWLRLTYLVPVGCQDTGTVLGQESNCFLSCLDPPGGGGWKRKEKYRYCSAQIG